MFLNREKEIERIRETVDKRKSHSKAILLYGLRRVGKTTLLKNALESFEGTVISYQAVDDTYNSNIRQFAAVAASVMNIPHIAYVSDLEAIISFIAGSGKRVVIVIDEYPLLRKAFKTGNLDSYFQRAIDTFTDNITFIFCGSYISTMKEMNEYSSPLFGRFDLVLHLRTFDYLDSSAFYRSLSPYEKIQYYAVFGGFPFVLERIEPEQGLVWNIKRTFLDDWDIVYSTINEILRTEISKIEGASAILSYLRNGRARNTELASETNASSSAISKELARLIDMDLIEKSNPINRKDDAKKTFYEISDNLIRFFYSFILPNRNYIAMYGPDAAYDNLLSRSLDTYISRRFERIVKEYIVRLIKSRQRPEFLSVGTYWYDLPKEKRNGEFDCVIQLGDGYEVLECKHLKDPMAKSLAEEEAKKIGRIEELEIKSIGFACSSGFDFTRSDWTLISGTDMYDI